MRRVKLSMVAIFGCLVLLTGSFTANAGQKRGGGGSTTPVIITFRDCNTGFPSAAFANLHPEVALLDLCPVLDDRVKSDTGFAYEDGLESVEAFISLSGGAGDLGLILPRSPRGLFLDFSDCASGPGSCNPPLPNGIESWVRIDLDAGQVKRDGLLGMAVLETISAPMRILLSDTADLSGNVWFINFNPNVRGKDPCKDKSSYVNVTRTSDTRWEVTFDPNQVACGSGASFLGTYHMPLQFTVQAK